MKKRILIIAAHPDDEVLGCGGTIAKHKRIGDEVYLLILSDGESSRANPDIESRMKALTASCQVLEIQNLKMSSFKDSHFDIYPLFEIIQEIENYAKSIAPHIVYTHSPSDLNQDHRVTYHATMVALRPIPESTVIKILTYEVPSSTEFGQSRSLPTFTPNYFEALSPEDIKHKTLALECYQLELRQSPHPRSLKNVHSLQIVRGHSVGVSSAEAFSIERFISR